MKYFLIIISIVVLTTNCGHSSSKQKSTWINGVLIIANKPIYFNPNKSDSSKLYMRQSYRGKYASKIVKGVELTIFKQEQEIQILNYNTETKKHEFKNIILIKYKTENNTLEVTTNDIVWYPVYFKVIENKPRYVTVDDINYKLLMIIYLECPWFKGEYEIVDPD